MSVRDNLDPLQYITDQMHAEQTNATRFIQELHVAPDGFIVLYFTEFAMHIFLLLTANDGPFGKACSTAMFDPQHGKEVFKMEFVTRNLFLRNHPLWIGAYAVFIRTRELDFSTMFEMLQRKQRFSRFASIRYADTDGQGALRRALEGPRGTLKADIGMDGPHLKRCFSTWLQNKTKLAQHVQKQMIASIENILQLDEDIEAVTQRLVDLIATFPPEVQQHFNLVHKDEILLAHKSRASHILCGRVKPCGTVVGGDTNPSESTHELGNRQAAAVQQERRAAGQPTSELHCWTDTIRNIFHQQSRDLLCARIHADSKQRLSDDTSRGNSPATRRHRSPPGWCRTSRCR